MFISWDRNTFLNKKVVGMWNVSSPKKYKTSKRKGGGVLLDWDVFFANGKMDGNKMETSDNGKKCTVGFS